MDRILAPTHRLLLPAQSLCREAMSPVLPPPPPPSLFLVPHSSLALAAMQSAAFIKEWTMLSSTSRAYERFRSFWADVSRLNTVWFIQHINTTCSTPHLKLLKAWTACSSSPASTILAWMEIKNKPAPKIHPPSCKSVHCLSAYTYSLCRRTLWEAITFIHAVLMCIMTHLCPQYVS